MKIAPLLFICLASAAFAQGQPPKLIAGPDAPLANDCQVLHTGDVYVRSENPANGPIEVFRCTQTGAISYGWMPIDHFVGPTLPPTCSTGAIAFQTGVTAGQNLFLCTANTWTAAATASAAGWTDDGTTISATAGRTVAVSSTGALTTPNVVFNAVTVLAPATANTGRILRYTHDTSVGACDTAGGGTAQTLCRSDGTNWLRVVEADAAGSVTIGTIALNPTTGIKAPIIACTGSPGNTTGPYGSLCEIRATGVMWACTNAANCTVSGDWTVSAGLTSIADQTVLGNVSGSTALPSAITQTQLFTLLGGTTGTGALVRATSPTVATPTLTGFIKGQFGSHDGVTGSVFQNSVTNGNTYFNLVPNGSGTRTGYFFYNTSDAIHEDLGVFFKLNGNPGIVSVSAASGDERGVDFDIAGRTYMHLSKSALGLVVLPNITAFNAPAATMAAYRGNGAVFSHRLGDDSDYGWVNQAGQTRVGNQFDKAATTTLADITGLTVNVIIGHSYSFRALLYVSADATGGHKYALAGTATASAVVYQINALNNSTNAMVITSRQTSLGGSAGQAGATTVLTEITGTLTASASGTLTVQFAQNAASGTSSVLVGSSFIVQDVP